ncbi:MAG TPA: S1/P1 nuclease [Chthoniobacter sp.]|jgi:hypothetical protein
MKTLLYHVYLIALLAFAPLHCFAWDNEGHETVVAVALKLDPSLRERLTAILKDLPNSPQWIELKQSELIPHNRYQTDKGDVDGWIAAATADPVKAATFPDWARDYNDYIANKFNLYHFYDSDYDDVTDPRYVQNPNALKVLPGFEQDLKGKTGGDRAWALTWVLHLVGDLHQPLHCCSKASPRNPKKSDEGGNLFKYEDSELHSFWDALPKKQYDADQDEYVSSLVSIAKTLPQTQTDDLDLTHWVNEAHDLITGIGYPASQKRDNAYDAKAHQIADKQLALAGARLAKLLEQYLPPAGN